MKVRLSTPRIASAGIRKHAAQSATCHSKGSSKGFLAVVGAYYTSVVVISYGRGTVLGIQPVCKRRGPGGREDHTIQDWQGLRRHWAVPTAPLIPKLWGPEAGEDVPRSPLLN